MQEIERADADGADAGFERRDGGLEPGEHATLRHAAGREVLDAGGVKLRDTNACLEDALDVRHETQLVGAQRHGDGGRGVVAVHVEAEAFPRVAIASERRDHG